MLTRENNRRSVALPLLIGAGIWLAFCWSMLSGLKVPGFRDSTYLYYPLFEWLDSEWSKGQVPLWNPFCNLGMSNVGDNTTSLFYPGKLIFFLRFLDYPTRYGLYISLHILFAGWGAFYFARVMRASIPGATLAAISYAGSGAVLTQATNVVYLVSAAWLPFAFAAIWQMVWPKKKSGFRSGVLAGIYCTMMILGGEPQMVYHVGLVAAATVACIVVGRLRRNRISNPQNHSKSEASIQSFLKPTLALLVLVIVTTLLSLIQIVPTYQWSKLSERSTSARPNLFELLSQNFKLTKTEPGSDSKQVDETNQNASWKSLIEPLNPNSVSFANYEFSLPPWNLLELFIPGGNGRSFPAHQRWADLLVSPQGIPDRVWFFSIYLGSVTAWLGLSGIRLRGAGRRAWLSRIAVSFLLGSFGWYGFSWLLPIPQCGSQVGGVYWWMNFLLPGYSSFRYPAKLFVIVSLMLSILAGLQLSARTFQSLNPLNSFLGWGWLGLLGIGLLAIHLNGFRTQAQGLPNDLLFGPFDVNGSIQSLRFSLLHSLSLAGLLMVVSLSYVRRLGVGNQRTNWPLWILVAITAVDLVIANRWVLALVPREAFTAEVSLPKLIESGIAPLTVYRKRDAFFPEHWQTRDSSHRLNEIIRWQRETLYPKHHLGHHVRLLGSFGSIQPRQNENLLNMLDGLPNGVEPPTVSPPDRPRTSEEVLTKLLLRLKKQDCDGQLVSVSTDRVNRTEITYWREQPQLVTLRPAEKEDQLGVDARHAGECKMIEFASNSILLRVNCSEACELVHSSLFDGNWEATVKSVSSGHTTNLKLVELGSGEQGIKLQSGNYEIRLDYVPRAFWNSAWVSLIAWILAVVYLTASRSR